MSNLKVKAPYEEESQSKKFRLGLRHIQLSLVFFSIVVLYAQRTSLSVAIIAMTEKTPPDPSIPTYPEWSNTDIILSSFFWGYIIPQIGAGQLGEYFGPKWFLVGTMTIGSIVNILIPFMAANYGSSGVMACRMIQGVNQGFLYPSVHNLISRWTPLDERSRATSFVFAGSSVGIIISMIFSGAIAGSELGWPTVFYMFGGGGVFWAMIFATFASNSPSSHPRISEAEKFMIEGSNSVDTKKVPTPWKSIVTSLPLWAVLITSMGQAWGTFTLLTEIPSYLSNVMNFDIKSNSGLSSLPYVALFLMNLVAGPVADKMITSNILTVGVTRKVANIIGTILPAVALFVLGFIDNTQKDLAIVLLVCAVGLTGFNHAGCTVNLIDLAPNHAGTLLGIVNGTSTIASILGPLSVEFLGDDKTDLVLWKKVFWIASGIYVVGGTFFAIFSKGELQDWNNIRDESVTQEKKDKKEIV